MVAWGKEGVGSDTRAIGVARATGSDPRGARRDGVVVVSLRWLAALDREVPPPPGGARASTTGSAQQASVVGGKERSDGE